MSLVKSLVSKKKKRFQENGFDLDLSYITPNIVAMGFPAEKLEGVYRNNIEDVMRCNERKYDICKFGENSVVCFPFEDHNPPPFEMMHRFCLDAHDYLNKHSQNTIFVHCKAGKGRTGVMIVCYLLYSNVCATFEAALEHYAKKRTHNMKGVTIPSQIRYIHYYSVCLTHCVRKNLRMETFYNPDSLILGPIVLNCKPFTKISTLAVKVSTREDKCLYQCTQDIRKVDTVVVFETPKNFIHLKGDIKLEFYQRDIFSKNSLIMSFWFNTFFIHPDFGEDPSLLSSEKKTTVLYSEQSTNFSIENSDRFDWINFPKNTIDRINKDVGSKIFPSDLEVYMGFLKKDFACDSFHMQQNITNLLVSQKDNETTPSTSLPNVIDGNSQLDVDFILAPSSDSNYPSDLSN